MRWPSSSSCGAFFHDAEASGTDCDCDLAEEFDMLALCDGFEAALEGFFGSDTCHICAGCDDELKRRRALCAEVREVACD